MSGLLLEEDLLVSNNIIDRHTPEGEKIHNYLLSRAKLLAGKVVDFDKTPVTFVMSDNKEPNAFHAPYITSEERRELRNDYEDVTTYVNPYKMPVICVTKGLIEMVSSQDELDYVLGHELTHLILDKYGIKGNSKGEEEISDLHAVDLVYDAGGDPKQSLEFERKITEYSNSIKAEERQKSEKKRRNRNRHGKNDKDISWLEVFDVHMTHANRKSALEASLTRISHLIDTRNPTALDKLVFGAEYSDPVDDFLKSKSYDTSSPLLKIKLLIDAIDVVSTNKAPELFYGRILADFPNEGDDDYSWVHDDKKKKILEDAQKGYPSYYRGKIVEKKYQQKIARLAEKVIEDIKEQREYEKNTSEASPYLNGTILHYYLMQKAYRYLKENDYPDANHNNALESAAIMYSYFHNYIDQNAFMRLKDNKPVELRETDIDKDMMLAIHTIKSTESAEEFSKAFAQYKTLESWYLGIDKNDFEHNRHKFDNLSFSFKWSNHRTDIMKVTHVYRDIDDCDNILWNNLLKVAAASENSKKEVIEFLGSLGYEDYRITHNEPYVKKYGHIYKIHSSGKIIDYRVSTDEFEFAVHRKEVLEVYDYIKKYFDGEEKIFNDIIKDVLNLTDDDFSKSADGSGMLYRGTVSKRKVRDFTSLYNSLFGKSAETKNGSIFEYIPRRYIEANPRPHTDEEGNLTIDRDLFLFKSPLFVQHFGSEFIDNIKAFREKQKAHMYKMAITLFKKAEDECLELFNSIDALEEKSNSLWGEIRKTKSKVKAQRLDKERDALYSKKEILRAKKDTYESLLWDFAHSVFKSAKYDNYLRDLSAKQKAYIADYVVADKKGVFRKVFDHKGYTNFCDYRKVLTNQVNAVVKGDFTLTPAMQIVASNVAYNDKWFSTEMPEASGDKYRGFIYLRYLKLFDALKHLQDNSKINLLEFTRLLSNIEIPHPSHSGSPDRYGIEEGIYRTYQKIMSEGPLIPALTKALSDKKNIESMKYHDAIVTIDNLIALREDFDRFLVVRKESNSGFEVGDETKKVEGKPEHLKFLSFFDQKIVDLLKYTYEKAITTPNALEKFENILDILNSKKDSYGDFNRHRYMQLASINAETIEKITKMSEKESFWPEDALEHVKAFVYAKNSFLDNSDIENTVINNMLDKVSKLNSGAVKSECLLALLDKKFRAAYPETRQRLFDIFSNDVASAIGRDDGSKTYLKKLETYLSGLGSDKRREWDKRDYDNLRSGLFAGSISEADKYMLLRGLSDAVISQEEGSAAIKKSSQIKLNSDDMVRSYLYGIGVDAVTSLLDKDSKTANTFIKFFNSKGERKDCSDLSTYLNKLFENDKKKGWSTTNVKPAECKILYENFWSAPLEARAFVIARILKSAVEDEGKTKRNWEKVFDVVMDNVISPTDKSVESKYARDIMHSYIKARSDYERELILSAMMVANRNIGKDAGNVGKALKLFLENMGPAEIKLGQAVASHPDTPDDIRKELQDLKNEASMPARWELYDWIRKEKVPQKFWKNEYLGEVLGSASYYTTVALGENSVLRILRPEAREKAVKGFRVLLDTVADLKIKDETTNLDYTQLTQSVSEMVAQADRMSVIETDHELGQKQYEYAQAIYNGVKITSGDNTFSFRVMDWNAKGKDWIIMDKAAGQTFNKLPEETPEQLKYKQQFAKAYIAFELRNILSGGKFDHDRHGAQLCLDEKTNKVGIFDTGAMALKDPTEEEQKLLGAVVYELVSSSQKSKSISSLGTMLSKKIEDMHKCGTDTKYLVEVQKGILALGDFFKVLKESDVTEILAMSDLPNHMSTHIKSVIIGNIGLKDKLKFAFTTFGKSSQHEVRIKKGLSINFSNVDSVNAISEVTSKASWLQETFVANSDKKKPETKKQPFVRHNSVQTLSM